MENNLKVGFARVNVTPPMGIPIWGYYIKRFADGVLDELEATAVALQSGDKTAIIMTVDHCGLVKAVLDEYRSEISKATSVAEDAIFIHSTHTHTGPEITPGSDNPLINEYNNTLKRKVCDLATFAIADLKDAKMGFGVGKAPNIAFIRRYRMKDGSVKTNPGVNNPDILCPMGEVDERVNVLRFDREGAESVVVVNFGNHPDTVGGSKISGDWPALTRRCVEKCIDNCKCIFFTGAQGDVNHVNVNPKAGDFNGMFNDFDGCSRGYLHTKHIANVVTGAVMQVYEKVEYTDVNEIKYTQQYINVNSNKPLPEEIPLAKKYHQLHLEGRDEEIPFKAMMLTTVLADSARKVRLENAPEFFPLMFSVIKIGDVALYGIPGEPFTPVGTSIKETEGYKLILPCCNTNGKEGYFPMMDSYEEGGYEAKSSSYKAGSAEKIIEESKKILKGLLKE